MHWETGVLAHLPPCSLLQPVLLNNWGGQSSANQSFLYRHGVSQARYQESTPKPPVSYLLSLLSPHFDGWGECVWGWRGVVNTGEQSPSGLFPERLFLAPLRDYLTIFLIVQGRLCTPPGDSRMKKALFRAWSKSQANQPEAEQPKCSSTKPLWNRREQCLDASLWSLLPPTHYLLVL